MLTMADRTDDRTFGGDPDHCLNAGKCKRPPGEGDFGDG